ncbi:CPBP family intramembrane metalloprotease [Photobacterium sp. SDRW27]|uniref:CPBP family intramembrane glutamic endopeptidase n=1 Tax=Photobacterium obscurum TaxID=2829490 RepID=UPI002244A919|nr:CPBP family intramembrane glutamic endopeptidase [Photobacterium obscurum]MCW8330931.1 CPBP family intramembrane metalloprotease [Photobacterium obscurum]
MGERLNALMYSTLGLNKTGFVVRVYGLAIVWAMALILINYFIFYQAEVVQALNESELASALVSLLITTPLMETLIFQCFIQSMLRHAKGSPAFSIVGSAIIFALVHLVNSILNAMVIVALGFALALTYEYVRMRVGNIYAFITVWIAHSIWNVFAILGIPALFLAFGLE